MYKNSIQDTGKFASVGIVIDIFCFAEVQMLFSLNFYLPVFSYNSV